MSRRFPVCTLSELKRRRSVTRWIDELRDEVVLVWLDDAAVAYSSVCPHFAGPLEPDFASRTLHCPWHGWRFGMDDGQCRTHSMKCAVRRYDVVDRDGELEVVTGEAADSAERSKPAQDRVVP